MRTRANLESQVREAGLAQQLARVVARLQSPVRDAFHDTTAHMRTHPGKMIRPLVLLGSAARPDDADVEDLAVATQWLQDASLIHDDLTDRSEERRGAPSVPVVYGGRVAYLAGIHSAGRALRLIGRVAAKRKLTLDLRDLRDLAAGQLHERAPRATTVAEARRRYREVIRGKTASLFVFAAAMGARCVGHPPEHERDVCASAGAFAEAFQVLDDVRDMEGAESLGKAPGGDLAARTITLPMIEWATLQAEPEAALRRFGTPMNAREREALRARIVADGACELARRFAREVILGGRFRVRGISLRSTRLVFDGLFDLVEAL